VQKVPCARTYHINVLLSVKSLAHGADDRSMVLQRYEPSCCLDSWCLPCLQIRLLCQGGATSPVYPGCWYAVPHIQTRETSQQQAWLQSDTSRPGCPCAVCG
jgi:hypothetical protein